MLNNAKWLFWMRVDVNKLHNYHCTRRDMSAKWTKHSIHQGWQVNSILASAFQFVLYKLILDMDHIVFIHMFLACGSYNLEKQHLYNYLIPSHVKRSWNWTNSFRFLGLIWMLCALPDVNLLSCYNFYLYLICSRVLFFKFGNDTLITFQGRSFNLEPLIVHLKLFSFLINRYLRICTESRVRIKKMDNSAVSTVLIFYDFMTSIILWYHEHDELI